MLNARMRIVSVERTVEQLVHGMDYPHLEQLELDATVSLQLRER